MTSREIDAGALETDERTNKIWCAALIIALRPQQISDTLSAFQQLRERKIVDDTLDRALSALPSPSVDEAFNEGVEAAKRAARKAYRDFCGAPTFGEVKREIEALKRPTASDGEARNRFKEGA